MPVQRHAVRFYVQRLTACASMTTEAVPSMTERESAFRIIALRFALFPNGTRAHDPNNASRRSVYPCASAMTTDTGAACLQYPCASAGVRAHAERVPVRWSAYP